MWKLGLRCFVDVDVRACALGEIAVAGHVIGVQVRLDDVGDLQMMRLRRIEIFLYVPIRVNDGGDSGAFAADQIRCAAQTIDEELLKIHDQTSHRVAISLGKLS